MGYFKTITSKRRVDQLLEKARQGSLTAAEGQELDEFIHVGNLLATVQSKARQALARAGLSRSLGPGE